MLTARFAPALLLAALTSAPLYATTQTPLTEQQVTTLVNGTLTPLIAEQQIPGMAVAVIYNGKTHFFNYGVADQKTERPVTEQTLFELGSISKTFTGVLGGFALQNGTIALDDPAVKYAPQLNSPQWRNITLGQLATYTAGGLPLQLPETASNWPSLWRFYQQWQPEWAPGVKRNYSNASIGLFGALVAKASGQSFESLMVKNVFRPLQLNHTCITIPSARQADYAWGYRDSKAVRVSPGMLDAEAYGVKSTSQDMASFMQVSMAPENLPVEQAPLKQAILASRSSYYQVGEMTQGLGWEMYRWPADPLRIVADSSNESALKPHAATALTPPRPPEAASWVHKTGSTNGFGAYIAYLPQQKIGIVMLANKSYPNPVRVAAAYHILQALQRQ